MKGTEEGRRVAGFRCGEETREGISRKGIFPGVFFHPSGGEKVLLLRTLYGEAHSLRPPPEEEVLLYNCQVRGGGLRNLKILRKRVPLFVRRFRGQIPF